jgi:XTP/dITP diphosphohydrolase
MDIIIASANAHKVREIRALCEGLPVTLLSLADFPGVPPVVEDGDTFEANARKKALAVAAATGKLALADDSGVEVDALGGAPGVHSARWAGRQGDDRANNAKLVAAMRAVPESRRTARYRCVIAVAGASGILFTAEGSCEGLVILEPRGANGFGYDPYMLIPDHGKTMAELAPEVKNRISHRGRALAACRLRLEELIRGGGVT